MKGGTEQTSIHYRGQHDDWIVFIDDVDQYNEWKQAQQQSDADADAADDKEKDAKFFVPLFVGGKDAIFVTHKQGPQGKKDTASKVDIASEFGTDDKKLAIKQILLQGTVAETKLNPRDGDKNIANGGTVAH